MATTTYLQSPTVNITVGATTTDLTDNCSSATITAAFDALESTAFGDTAHKFVKGLQNNQISLTLYTSYGAGEIEATLYDAWNTGACTLVISPSGTSESASNPEYTLTNCMLASFTPISGAFGELATIEAVFQGGALTRDITAP
ncbi:MAG: hypothetical protein ACO25P_07880 [Ilumatobacteraceae bacterium]